MNYKKNMNYPGTDIPITSPFFVVACSCGYKAWSTLPNATLCPICGKEMKIEGGEKEQSNIFGGK